MNNYKLYYPETYWMLGFVFLPLSADENDVKSLENDIHNYAQPYHWTNEWFNVPNIQRLFSVLREGSKQYPKAIVVTDLSKRIRLSSEYIPTPLKDRKAIEKITKEYEQEKKAREDEKKKRAIAQRPNNNRGPAYNTRFFNLKRGVEGTKSNPIHL